MKVTTTALSIHEIGRRANQEDSLYPDRGAESFSSGLYILCDGMGGHSAGEVASGTIAQEMASYLGEHYREGAPFTEALFQSALNYAHDILDTKDDGAVRKMGTTLTFLFFHPGGAFVAHMGDSRVYQIRPSSGSVLFKTKDHSLVNDLLSLGEITPEQARTSPQKNVITRAIQAGQGRRTKADCANLSDIRPGDYFYMCSDGMLEEMEDVNLVNILSMDASDERKRSILIERTKENRDNHSAHIIKVLSVDGTFIQDTAPAPATSSEDDDSAERTTLPGGEMVRVESVREVTGMEPRPHHVKEPSSVKGEKVSDSFEREPRIPLEKDRDEETTQVGPLKPSSHDVPRSTHPAPVAKTPRPATRKSGNTVLSIIIGCLIALAVLVGGLFIYKSLKSKGARGSTVQKVDIGPEREATALLDGGTLSLFAGINDE